MKSKNSNKDLDYALVLFDSMQKDNLGYIYRGRFTQEITDHILSLAETNLEKEEQSSKIRKRVYSIMVECLQNITRHQENHSVIYPYNFGIFVIQKKEDKYYITSGNSIERKNIDYLERLINKINNLEKDELKEYYKQVLNEGEISHKGGAGLGLIDMARKSGNKLSFKFQNLTKTHSYFYLHTVPSLINIDNKLGDYKDDSLENIVDIHKLLNNENILLVFNGALNQESLINLLSSIEGQMVGSGNFRKKVFYIVVEMLQNIAKHASNRYNNPMGNPGIFFIGEKNKEYFITSGNYINKKDIEELKDKIDHVNTLVNSELEDYYSRCLFDFEINDNKKAGLGIIDLRIKSGNEVNYHFVDIDENHSFFALQTKILIN